MKRALVTGARGFLGRYLVACLEAEGWKVGQVVRRNFTPGTQVPELELRKGHIDDFERLFTGFQPDVVFHMAGKTGAQNASELYTANTVLAANLLQAVERAGRPIRVVLAGSAAEYGPVPADELPVREDRPCSPANDYGISKYAQTLMGLARARTGHPVLIARIFNPIGAGMPEHLALAGFAAQLRHGEGQCLLHAGNLEVERDFIDAAEAARVMVAVGSAPENYGAVYNICSGRAFMLGRLLDEMVRLSGRPTTIIRDPARIRAGDMPLFYGSTARLEAIGIRPREPDFAAIMPRLLE